MITAIIQARMSSTRLPGKVLLPLGDTTVLGHTVARVKKASRVGKIIIATSQEPEDDAIAEAAHKLGVEIYRGSLTDVLDRYYQAAKISGAEHICRITSDCPLIDPGVIDNVAQQYEKTGCNYISTGRIESTFPDGMDTEIFSYTALEQAWNEAVLPSEREHVTPYIWKHPEKFTVAEVRNERDLSKIRLTIDEANDYMLLKDVVENVHDLSMNGIVDYLTKHPAIAALNGSNVRDAGYAKSLKEDAL